MSGEGAVAGQGYSSIMAASAASVAKAIMKIKARYRAWLAGAAPQRHTTDAITPPHRPAPYESRGRSRFHPVGQFGVGSIVPACYVSVVTRWAAGRA